MAVWYALRAGPLRHKEIALRLEASPQALSNALRALVESGAVERRDLGGSPVRTEYALRGDVSFLEAATEALHAWADSLAAV